MPTARSQQVLARPLVQAGVRYEVGATVALTAAQVARLAVLDYFHAAPAAVKSRTARKSGDNHDKGSNAA